MIFAIDFDGTICVNKFPEIGDPMIGAFETIKALEDNGHWCFLYTMRDYYESTYGHRNLLKEAIDFCQSHNVKFNSINKSPVTFNKSTKQYADFYIDDSTMFGPLSMCLHTEEYIRTNAWKEIGKMLISISAITKKQYDTIWKE